MFLLLTKCPIDCGIFIGETRYRMPPSIITKPKVEVSPELLSQINETFSQEGQVIVHCLVSASPFTEMGIRIWPTTYLYDLQSKHRSELVHFENITSYPTWKLIPPGKSSFFTLIFSKLPKSCLRFDLIEEIPQSGGFEVRNRSRNGTDVYFVRF